MEFEGQYLTYEEYKALGGTLDLMPFNLLEFEARRRIDIRTQNRLKNSDNVPNEVKLCDMSLINMTKKYLDNENKEKQNIASESTDGYSVTYNTITLDKIKEIMDSKKAEVSDILETYLVGVVFNRKHIAYLGVDR